MADPRHEPAMRWKVRLAHLSTPDAYHTRQLEALLDDGWEPFAAQHRDSLTDLVWLRKQEPHSASTSSPEETS